MFRVASAVLGFFAVQILHLALQMPQMQAAWGWVMEVPSGRGFTCKEGSSIGPDQNFACTVAPDSNMECDVSSTSVVCYKTATPDATFKPTNGMCINMGHPPNRTDNDSAIKWSSVPTCTRGGASSAPMAATFGAGFAMSLLCV